MKAKAKIQTRAVVDHCSDFTTRSFVIRDQVSNQFVIMVKGKGIARAHACSDDDFAKAWQFASLEEARRQAKRCADLSGRKMEIMGGLVRNSTGELVALIRYEPALVEQPCEEKA